MTHHFHAVVWIDHAKAVIFEFAEGDVSEHRIKATDRRAISTIRQGRLVPVTPMTASPI